MKSIDVQLTDNKQNPNTKELPGDLFDDLPSWLSSPGLAFSSWISAEPVSASTRKVRLSMWNKFCRWMNSHDIGLESCQSVHITDFIKEHKLEKEHAWRYVKLIERVYFHLSVLGLRTPNPGQSAGKKGVGNRRNDPMRVLSKIEKQKIERYLLKIFDEAEGLARLEEWKKSKKSKKAEWWAVVRDSAITAVLVGAGVKVGEVVELSVNCTSDGFLVFPQKGLCLARKVPLLPIAVRALEVWALYRNDSLEIGQVLFPALISRRRTDQLVKTAAMHPATIFRRLRDLLGEAGVSGSRAAGQTLRNTYAAALIDNGATDAILIEALGFHGDFSVHHLRQEHKLAQLTSF